MGLLNWIRQLKKNSKSSTNQSKDNRRYIPLAEGFTADRELGPEALSQDFMKLYELSVINYKILDEEKFQVSFHRNFLAFVNQFNDKLGYITYTYARQYVEDTGKLMTEKDYFMTWISTTLIHYVVATRQTDKLDLNDEKRMNSICTTLAEMNIITDRLYGQKKGK